MRLGALVPIRRGPPGVRPTRRGARCGLEGHPRPSVRCPVPDPTRPCPHPWSDPRGAHGVTGRHEVTQPWNGGGARVDRLSHPTSHPTLPRRGTSRCRPEPEGDPRPHVYPHTLGLVYKRVYTPTCVRCAGSRGTRGCLLPFSVSDGIVRRGSESPTGLSSTLKN